MKKLFLAVLISCMMFSTNAIANGNGPPIMTDTGNIAGDLEFDYTHLEGDFHESSGVEESSNVNTFNRELDISGEWNRSLNIKKNCSYSGGGEAIGGQAQLPIQIAYFSEEMTVLGQGGIQVQAGMVEGGASVAQDQNFTNMMVFEGLTMEQSATQSSVISGTPETEECNFELSKNESLVVDAHYRESNVNNSTFNSSYESMDYQNVEYTNLGGNAAFEGSYTNQSIGNGGCY